VRIFILLGTFCFLLFSCSQNTGINKQYDIVVYGGTSSGVITAYAASQLGKSVILIEPSNKLGGLSSGGLGQTDIGNKHAIIGLGRDFYRQLGKHYNTLEAWKFEPKIALQTFENYISKANIPVIYNHSISNVKIKSGRIKSIIIRQTQPDLVSYDTTIDADVFIDCSYEGDLLAMAGVSYTVGREDNNTYKETINGVQKMDGHQFPDGVDPYVVKGKPESGLIWGISNEKLENSGSGDQKVQAYNFRICLTDNPDNSIPIARPGNYDSTKYELLLRLMNAQSDKHKLSDYFIWSIMPNNKTDINNRGGFSTDMIGMNYDYPEGNWEDRFKIIEDHKDYTQGLLYFIGHDPGIPEEIQDEMLKWGYPRDEYLDTDHWSPQLYIREARRLIGEYVMTEHHCRGDKHTSDPIALAAYTMDSHNCQRLVVNNMVKNEGNVEVGGFPPYSIAYSSLTPKDEECKNLIVPVCLSASHIAFGSIRMEPVFMVLGQVSAIAASLSIDHKIDVQQVDYKEINKLMSEDPLLNGTPPDIVLDNEDQNIAYNGNWVKESHFMRNYKNSLMILDHPGHDDLFEFNTTIADSAAYDIYLYCPMYSWNSDRTVYPEEMSIIVQGDSEPINFQINYTDNLGDWASIGRFEFDRNEKISIKITGKNANYPIVADAVLLTPSR
jgi:hypothetical protein